MGRKNANAQRVTRKAKRRRAKREEARQQMARFGGRRVAPKR